MSQIIILDPQSVRDVEIDWSNYLVQGESIVSSQWSVKPSGDLSVDTSSSTATTTTATVSGGLPGGTYFLENHITTDMQNREDDRTIMVVVSERL